MQSAVAPVLTKKQRKKTLAEQKAKRTIAKTVISTPYNNGYWPCLQLEDGVTLKGVLENHLPLLQEENNNILWKEIKHIPRENRKKFREKLRENQIKPDLEHRKSVALGVNKVTKLLEKNLAECVLVAEDVKPRIMVKHVVELCVLFQVPILVVENLREILRKKCGISTTTFAIKKDFCENTDLRAIAACIKQIHLNYPFLETHINYLRPVDSQPYTETVEQEQKPEIHKKPAIKTPLNEEAIKRKFHLPRKSPTSRTFIPSTNKSETNIIEAMESEDFIPIPSEPPRQQPTKRSYKSLIVQRLKGNPNRNKRKIDQIKRKRTHD